MRTDKVFRPLGPIAALFKIQKRRLKTKEAADILMRAVETARGHLRSGNAVAIAALYAHPFANFLPEELRTVMEHASAGKITFSEADAYLERLSKHYHAAFIRKGIPIPVRPGTG